MKFRTILFPIVLALTSVSAQATESLNFGVSTPSSFSFINQSLGFSGASSTLILESCLEGGFFHLVTTKSHHALLKLR